MEEKGKTQVSQGVTRRVLIALLLAVLSVGSLIGAIRPVPQEIEGVQVKFRQLNWRGAGNTIRFPNSQVATAVFSFDGSAADPLIGKGGYVNLVVQVPGVSGREWAVQNLFLRYKNERFLLGSHPSVQFPLPIARASRVPQISYLLTLTPEPLSAPPAGGLLRAPVASKNYRVGGFLRGGSEKAALSPRVGPWIGLRLNKSGELDVAIDRESTTEVAVADLPEIDEDVNGCAPAGVARSIQYMTDNEGVSLAGDAQDIYDDLYDNMGTTGAGTATGQDIADGKAQFADDNDLDIDTTLSEDGIGDIGDAMDTLDDGGDVEILIRWPDGSGHVAMITSIVDRGDGTYEITYVDDPDQGDGVAENEEHVIIVDGNGDITSGGTGSIHGLLIETLTPPAPPPPPPGPTPIGDSTHIGGQ